MNVFEREPTPSQPICLDDGQLRKLGELRGRMWFTTAGQDGEFELLTDERPIPDRHPTLRLDPGAVYVEAWRSVEVRGRQDRERIWWPTRRHPFGTYERGGRPPAVAPPPRRQKPLRSVDALGILGALAPRPEEIIAIGKERDERLDAATGFGGKGPALRARFVEGRGPVRGPAVILDLLARKGHVTAEPDRYACHVDYRTPGGGLDPAFRQVIERADRELLCPFLGATNTPPPITGPARCHATIHTGDPAEAPLAVSLGPGDMPVCDECLG